MPLKDMYESCNQCGFAFARVDTEAWGKSSARRLMCPVCGWTAYDEIRWDEDQPHVIKHSESKGFGAFRLIPPGGYCGYNAFHERPSSEVLHSLRDLMVNKGWKGYISLWNEAEGKASLLLGSPLDKFAVIEKK
ncbi:MAG: hypothetical protein M0023_10425 [Desulfobacteraceae bacterium]|nr:hypothetical protein [Desulfobacteraceae bacterium]